MPRFERKMRFDQVWRIATNALKKGAIRVSPTRIEWRVAGNCEDPIELNFHARPPAKGDQKYVTVGPGRKVPFDLTIWGRCRKCRKCMKSNQNKWVARIMREHMLAQQRGCRAWKFTLTCSPVYLLLRKMVASNECALKNQDFEALPGPVRFALLDEVIYRDIVKFVKRARRGRGALAPAEFRFICVTEMTPPFRKTGEVNENAGEPHYHMLVHELYADRPVRQRAFREAGWPGGIHRYKLVEEGEDPAYACKYLTKDGGRVRSSIMYGKSSIEDAS